MAKTTAAAWAEIDVPSASGQLGGLAAPGSRIQVSFSQLMTEDFDMY